MADVSPAQEQLAERLRRLREEHWEGVRVTQADLAAALADGASLSGATVSSWENQSSPKPPPADRLRAYARFFATRRSVEGGKPRLLPLDTFSEEENTARHALEDELLALREEAISPTPAAKVVAARRSWRFSDTGPVNIICAQLPPEQAGSLIDPSDPNFTELQSFADLDSLIELHGHLRRENPDMDVHFKASTKVVPDDLSGHVVLLGGVAYNEITEILSQMTVLPVRQVADPTVKSGEIFVADTEGGEQKFLPKWRNNETHTNLREDVGLLARTPNPLNSNRTLTICNGVHSRGVLGAVRTLTDARLRESNERFLAQSFNNSSTFAILMRVTVIEGRTMTPDFNTPGSVLYHWQEDSDS